MITKYAITLILLPLLSLSAAADGITTSKSTDAIINLPLTDTWNLFTTTNGLMAMGLILNGFKR